MTDPLARYIDALETLDTGSMSALCELIDESVHFVDPFNDSHGRDAYRRVLEDMFDKLGDVDFVVQHAAWSGHSPSRTALLKWTLRARLWGRPWAVEGCSEVTFNDAGLVVAHRDVWDPTSAVYARIPVLGWLLAAIRRRIGVT